jgi:hypothetical protein
MMIKSKSLMIVLSLLFSLIAISNTWADIGQIIQAGIGYLEANQDESGLWGTDKQTPFRDAAVVVDVLGILDVVYEVDPAKIASGYQAVNSISTNSTDYLARKILAQASVNQGVVDPALLASLVNMQNEDGGWGYQKYYGSNTLETALALQALVAASYVDATPSVVFAPASSFLLSNQHSSSPDFGWGFVSDGDSKVFFTAHAVIALSALQNYDASYNFTTQMANAFSWLQLVQDVEGGFGSDGNLNAYETGLAIAAMIAFDPTAREIQNARGYLQSSQLPNGSWNDDAYSTAMAIYGLHCISPFLIDYLPGDANMGNGGWPPAVTSGNDVPYLVNYFKLNPCCPGCKLGGFYASADINGNCQVTGADVNRLIAYFKGTATISYCPDYPPAWLKASEAPPSAPSGWPNCDARMARMLIIPGEPTNRSDNK